MSQPPYGPPPQHPNQPPYGPPPQHPNQPPYGPPAQYSAQPPYGPPAQQPFAPPQQPARKPFYKKAWFIVLAALVVIGAIAGQRGGSDDSTEASAGSSAAESPASDGSGAAEAAPGGADVDVETVEAAPETADAAPGIGQPARDGKFEFIVNGVDCSLTEVGSQYFNTTAQGTFCIVDLTVRNIGDEPQSFFGDNATLYNSQGQEFSADSEAAIYLEESSSLYEEINPGNMLTSKVVFDVPVGTAPASIELHDSMLSGGVTVALQ